MIGRLGNEAAKSLIVNETETKQVEKTPPAEVQELAKTLTPVQDPKVGQTRMADLAFTGSIHKAFLDVALQQSAPSEKAPASVGSTSIGSNANDEIDDLKYSAEFKSLDPRVQSEVKSAYVALEKDPVGQKNLLELVHNPEFAYLLSPDAQSAAVNGLMQNPKGIKELKMLVLDAAVMEKNKNFNSLPEETKRNALGTMFSKGMSAGFIEYNGTNNISELVTDDNFGKLTPKQQDQLLEVVRMNPKINIPAYLEQMIGNSTFQNMDSGMQGRVINIMHENTSRAATTTGDWKKNDENLSQLMDLLNDPAFIQASDDEKWAQLNPLYGRTGL